MKSISSGIKALKRNALPIALSSAMLLSGCGGNEKSERNIEKQLSKSGETGYVGQLFFGGGDFLNNNLWRRNFVYYDLDSGKKVSIHEERDTVDKLIKEGYDLKLNSFGMLGSFQDIHPERYRRNCLHLGKEFIDEEGNPKIKEILDALPSIDRKYQHEIRSRLYRNSTEPFLLFVRTDEERNFILNRVHCWKGFGIFPGVKIDVYEVNDSAIPEAYKQKDRILPPLNDSGASYIPVMDAPFVYEDSLPIPRNSVNSRFSLESMLDV